MSKTANVKPASVEEDAARIEEIRSRIFSLIGEGHGNGQALRRALNIESKNVITEWKTGRSKSFRNYIPQIAEFYGVSTDWILGISDSKLEVKKNNPDTVSSAEAEFDEDFINTMRLLDKRQREIVKSLAKSLLTSSEE